MLALDLVRTLDLKTPTAPGRAHHVAAASGLVRAGAYLYVIADDELHLAVFPADGAEPGQLIRLFAGSLPSSPARRKAKKPDFEALALLPPMENCPNGALLALGSGSTQLRRRGALLALARDSSVAHEPEVLDLSPLFDAVSGVFREPNIEGVVTSGSDLLLFQRGNSSRPDNAVIRFDLIAVMETLRSGDPAQLAASAVDRIDLGRIDGVPLCFTDATAMSGGEIVFSAIAEDTADSYRDGPLVGGAIGILDEHGQVTRLDQIEPTVKVEGIAARLVTGGIQLTLVTDADDPAQPARLYEAVLLHNR